MYNTQKRLGSVGPCLATLASLAREDIRSRMREQLFSPVFHLSLIIAHTHTVLLQRLLRSKAAAAAAAAAIAELTRQVSD